MHIDTNGEDDVILIDTRAERTVRCDAATLMELGLLLACAVVLLVALLLVGCGPVAANPHHWVQLKGLDASPYPEQWDWVDDKTGRSDDCQITKDLYGPAWEVFRRGAGYGTYQTLEQAKQECYKVQYY